MTVPELRKWIAIGAGIGIEVSSGDLIVTAVRVRPTGARVLGWTVIPRFQERPASEWGAEYAELMRKWGVGHLAATVLLPRREVIVRQIHLAGVSNRDLDGAIRFQIDSLHPYGDDDAVYAAARIGSTPHVLIGIVRRGVVDRYSALFAEAGIKMAAVTFSAAAVYSSLRMVSTPPSNGFLAVHQAAGEAMEAYGESESWPVFSVNLAGESQRAASLAKAELRLPPDAETVHLPKLLPPPLKAPEDFDLSRAALSYAGALAGACPRLALAANLLPPEARSASSRVLYVPTIALASLLLLGVAALGLYGRIEDRRYLASLKAEIAKLEPGARKVAELDAAVAKARARIQLLNEFKRRTQSDLDALNELTKVLAPPIWISNLELTRKSAVLAGEAEQAAGLLKIIDASPLFQNAQFTMPFAKVGGNEAFRVQAEREGTSQ